MRHYRSRLREGRPSRAFVFFQIPASKGRFLRKQARAPAVPRLLPLLRSLAGLFERLFEVRQEVFGLLDTNGQAN
jgi:hypothetical protein